ncbi:hypothetical protein BC829DRAFT_422130 [Chytridium lagenaria]|nr:hypothetical protein BC829DRAFT_422130 [Chytridium lagenaria]
MARHSVATVFQGRLLLSKCPFVKSMDGLTGDVGHCRSGIGTIAFTKLLIKLPSGRSVPSDMFLEWSGFGISPPPPPDMFEESGMWSMERILEAKRGREERRRRGVKVVEALARAEEAVVEMGI